MDNKPRSTKLFIGVIISIWGICAWGTRAINATEFSSVPTPVTKSPASSTAPLSETGTTAKAYRGTSAQVKQAQRQVQVFFPKSGSMEDVRAVSRTTSRQDLAAFAIEQLIAGPTSQEKKQGLIGPIKLNGNSNCGGKNFTVSVNKGLARLKFCKGVLSAGIGDDARVKSSINATLKQFTTVTSVVILTKDGNCFGDMSGDNMCLRQGQ